MCKNYYKCSKCELDKNIDEFVTDSDGCVLIAFCQECSDKYLIENVECACSVCKRKLPPSHFQHYNTRFKSNGKRLRVNTNCKDCTKKEEKTRRELKKENQPPTYPNKCPQCNKMCYEKTEHIPEGIDGTNGPWQMDHDHSTGDFRGYLCKRCNTGTGLIGDNEDYWREANRRKNNNVGT